MRRGAAGVAAKSSMISFAADYFIMVFVASLGVIQAAASIGGLRGLLVFKHPRIARTLGIALAIGAIVWFFAVAERNINDYEGGLDSNQQGILFFLAVATGGILTCALTSLLNKRLRRNRDARQSGDAQDAYDARHDATHAPFPGLGSLRYGSWWQAMTQNYRYWYRDAKCWRTQIKRYFSG
ncbi:MAG: hypothetical protein OXI16_04470 [Chloroflexota bacterium]|nr:hypothetical protein [Chloroflexota bacterium]